MANEFYSAFTPQEAKDFEEAVRQGPTAMTQFLQGLHGGAPEQPRNDRGQFVAAAGAPDAAAQKAAADAAKAAAAPKEFRQTVSIGGHDFEFVGSSAENLQAQVDSAKSVYERFQAAAPAARTNPARDILRQNELQEQFRAGIIDAETYLKSSGLIQQAVDEHLSAAGFDVNRAAGEQFARTWQEVSEQFLQQSDWPGGDKNLHLLSDKLSAMGLDTEPSVDSLNRAYAELKAAGTLFDGDHSAQELEEKAIASGASPQEIIQAWKDAQPAPGGSSDKANSEFIRLHQGGRRQSSTILGR